jgi:hypothetical protein
MAVAAVLSGLALVDLTMVGCRGRVPLMAKEVPDKFRSLGCFIRNGDRTTFIIDSYAKDQNGVPKHSRADLLNLLNLLRQGNAEIYTTLDTYLTLVYAWKVLKPEEVHRVFPHPAEEHCQHVPEVSKEQDNRLRRVAHYYWHLSKKETIDWDGKTTTFAHRASNTLSYRSFAVYQTIQRESRYRIKPVHPEHKVLQFDWSAAEWSLILQTCGYEVPDDAYEMFTRAGLNRDPTKKIILSWVYGSSHDSLVRSMQEMGETEGTVIRVLSQVEETYPKVLGWKATCQSSESMDFMGWKINLGEQAYKRPNHFAQTALQLCKWDLLDRLLSVDGHVLACGDIHDQLLFDFHPQQHRESIVAVIDQIQKPMMGIKLKANLKVGGDWKD